MKDLPDATFDLARTFVRESPLGRDHVQDLVGREQNVAETIENPLAEGQLNRRDRIEIKAF